MRPKVTNIDLAQQGERMLTMDGAAIVLDCASQDQREDVTISEEATDYIARSSAQWVLSRIMRKRDRTGRMAKNVKVEIRVTLDDDPRSTEPPLHLHIPNGSHGGPRP